MNEVVLMPESEDKIDLSRRKIVRLGYRTVLESILFKGNRLPHCVTVFDGPGLPDDVTILSVHEDHWSRSFVVCVQHDSFEQVPEGIPSPCWNGPMGLTWKVVELKQEGKE